MKNNNNLTPIELKEQLIKLFVYYYPNPFSQRSEITNDLRKNQEFIVGIIILMVLFI